MEDPAICVGSSCPRRAFGADCDWQRQMTADSENAHSWPMVIRLDHDRGRHPPHRHGLRK